jgi:N-acetylmuramoyl-L-alanine amidase
VIVAIDAGHGEIRAQGRHGTREKDVTLAIAAPKTRSTRNRTCVPCWCVTATTHPARAARAKAARERRLFVSIHADAWVSPTRGSSVRPVGAGATSAAARHGAEGEQSDLIGGVNLGVRDPILARTLLDLADGDHQRLPARAPCSPVGRRELAAQVRGGAGGFAVLKAPDVPSILVETAFISNPDEEKRLKDSAYQDKMATAILGGIKRYLSQNPPLARNRLAAS